MRHPGCPGPSGSREFAVPAPLPGFRSAHPASPCAGRDRVRGPDWRRARRYDDILEAITSLADILLRMETHQHRKRAMLRKLHWQLEQRAASNGRDISPG